MSFGKMNGLADIIITKKVKDSEGFTTMADEVLASVRVYREGRHGSQRWVNLAAFSEATDLFRFRSIPGLGITTDHIIVTAWRLSWRRRRRRRGAGFRHKKMSTPPGAHFLCAQNFFLPVQVRPVRDRSDRAA